MLLDQIYFALDAESLAAFQTLLDKPPVPTDRLRLTLKAGEPWEPAAATAKIAGRRVR